MCCCLATAALLVWLGAGLRRDAQDASLLRAVQNRQTVHVIGLLRQGANSNTRLPVDGAPEWREVFERLRRLVIAAPHRQTLDDRKGQTALMLAVRTHDQTLIRALIHAGADVNAQTAYGDSAFGAAVDTQDPALVRLLAANGADVNAANVNMLTPLMYAIAVEGPQCVNILRELCDAGADVNLRDPTGTTPLIWAANGDSVAAVKFLLERGADVRATDGEGKTALQMALESGQPHIARVLRRMEQASQDLLSSGPGRRQP